MNCIIELNECIIELNECIIELNECIIECVIVNIITSNIKAMIRYQ